MRGDDLTKEEKTQPVAQARRAEQKRSQSNREQRQNSAVQREGEEKRRRRVSELRGRHRVR